jgi:hypothetical protein
MQQLLVRLGLWKYVKNNQEPDVKKRDEHSAWETGCEKARAEIALCVSAEVMHIGGPSDHLELFQDEIGIKMMDNRRALRSQLFHAGKQSPQPMGEVIEP